MIISGKTALGIEFGSTRIKGVLVDENNKPIASGGHDWENRYDNGIWTYTLEDIWTGLQDCYASLAAEVKEKYDTELTTVGAIGFSAMMHGYMPFDKNGKLLVPFRTWRNTITEQAAAALTKEFSFNIPQRWSIAHLYQAILNNEEHVADIDFITTLDGYVHYMLTGRNAVGIGTASGMFPIDSAAKDYDKGMMDKFNALIADKSLPWKIGDILPEVLIAGENAGTLTAEGAKLLDPTGKLQSGIPMCPSEGDAGTGMAATNSVAVRTGNVSAGTSVFAMVVLEKPLSKVYGAIDLVTTPVGDPVAMVHCNNCTSDINAWVGIFRDFSEAAGIDISTSQLYELLFKQAAAGDKDCGGLLSYCYFSGEHITGFEEGRPLLARTPESKFSLANLMRANLYTSLGALKIGMDILLKEENVKLDRMFGHGGLFKTKDVGQSIMAAAINTPVSLLETAGEGGAWGIALLASYMKNKAEGETLPEFLENKVFTEGGAYTLEPDAADVEGYNVFSKRYAEGLAIERAAVESLKQ